MDIMTDDRFISYLPYFLLPDYLSTKRQQPGREPFLPWGTTGTIHTTLSSSLADDNII